MNKIKLISLLIAIIMITSAFAACNTPDENITTEPPTQETTEAPDTITTEKPSDETKETTEENTEENTEVDTEENTEIKLEGKYGEVIENANALANAVQDYYVNNNRAAYYVENNNMSFEYLLKSTADQQISALKNTQGKSYIENTFDVFVKTTDGKTFYASKNSNNATVNVFRYGYYYNEVRFEGQNFLNGSEILNESVISLKPDYVMNANGKNSDDSLRVVVKDPSDPYIVFAGINHDTASHKYFEITLKTEAEGSGATIYLAAGKETNFNNDQQVSFSLNADGEYHTYTVYLGNIPGFTGDITKLRLDLDNTNKGDDFDISSVKLVDAAPNGISSLSVARIFHLYSDKLHHELQLVAHEMNENIAEIGMVTNIAADTVDKLIVKDSAGYHETLEGVDWATAEYIGFDIKDTGVFGYILPVDDTTGTMTVTLKNGIYTIIQSRVPENNTVIPGEGDYTDMSGKSGNTNDFYMGQRLYTDENHTFDAFITEAEIERNPLTAKNIKVSSVYSDLGAKFVGYDPIRGSYEFYIMGTDFNTAYIQYPNRHFGLNFTVRSDKYDRNIYVLATTDSGCLECAVVLDENMMMLPIPVEVGKNFGTDQDANIYDRFDLSYGDAIFPVVVTGDEALEFNVLHLYQNWGNYPLKQISFIEYYFPYYHFSTGVTETNCISIHYGDKGNLLPDHRAMSAPLWSDQPQHTSGGAHTIFYYNDEAERFVGTTIAEKYIDSYGPVYADVTMEIMSGDGRIKATYTHLEMPQTDENRGYYTISFEFLEDVSFKNFKDSFSLYTVSDNDPEGKYQLFGYLNEKNEPTIVNANINGPATTYVLGTEAPYFDYCNMKDCKGSGGPGGTYVNTSFIICSSEIIIGGEEQTPGFIVQEGKLVANLTLNLGRVTFKAGDTITINALITPWGSQESDYSGVNFAPDQNVRDMRENSALDPFKVTAGADTEVIESFYLPKVKTTNGKSAEFTISGGENNVAVRVYGFKDLSVPKVYEKIGGEWVEYKLNSAGDPDLSGYHAYYDGYNVYYDGNGTYSYAFVTTITDGESRTFKVETDDSFVGWPRVETEDVSVDKLPVYLDPMEIYNLAVKYPGSMFYESGEVTSENGVQFAHLAPRMVDSKYPESYLFLKDYDEENITVTGQYFVLKYKTNIQENPYFEIFTSTQNTSPKGTDAISVISAGNGLYLADGEWHIVIIDLSKCGNTFAPAEDGTYIANYLRLDTSNSHGEYAITEGLYTDIAYVGLTDDLKSAVTLDTTIADILFYDGTLTVYSSATGEPK